MGPALFSVHYFQHDTIRGGESGLLFYLYRNLCIRCHFKAKLFQDSSKCKFDFHLRKPHSNTVVRTVTKWQISIGVTWLFGIGRESHGVKLLWVRPKFGVPMHAVHWHKDRCSFLYPQSLDETVFYSFSYKNRSYREKMYINFNFVYKNGRFRQDMRPLSASQSIVVLNSYFFEIPGWLKLSSKVLVGDTIIC